MQLKSEADLAGLPQSIKDAAAAAAAEKKQEGWLIVNTRSSVDPFLTYSDRRDLREKVWRMFIMRGDNGDERDNNATITQDSATARRTRQAARLSDACALACRELNGENA